MGLLNGGPHASPSSGLTMIKRVWIAATRIIVPADLSGRLVNLIRLPSDGQEAGPLEGPCRGLEPRGPR
jgi:hypothetical protein